MVSEDKTTKAKALYSYRAANNDELTFRRGDIITVTQRDPDGAWWEGMLNSNIGWFPSNYVAPHTSSDIVQETTFDVVCEQHGSSSLILCDMIQSERNFIDELAQIISCFLIPLRKSQRLPVDECAVLTGNLEEVIDLHSKLLVELLIQEKVQSKLSEYPDGDQPRVGLTFLDHALEIRRVQLAYCRSHPQAVVLLNKYKDILNTFLETLGAPFPDVMALTTGLSLVFRRLDKYPAMLLEYGRFLAEVHPDRGNIHRAIHVYKDISICCTNRRRRRELELEILSGKVLLWQGDPVSTLGDIVHFDAVLSVNGKRDRHLVLFKNVMVHLTVSSRLSAFVYEGRLLLASISSVSRIMGSCDYENAFEVNGEDNGRTIIECASTRDREVWLDAILLQMKQLQLGFDIADVTSAAPPLPPHHFKQERNVPRRLWCASKLRPTIPLRPSLALGREDSARKSSRHIIYKQRKNIYDSNMDKSFESDNVLLRVIELYCSSNTTVLRKPGNHDATFPSTVGNTDDNAVSNADGLVWQSLSKQVNQLVSEVNQLRRMLDDEIKQRQQLELFVNVHLKPDDTNAP